MKLFIAHVYTYLSCGPVCLNSFPEVRILTITCDSICQASLHLSSGVSSAIHAHLSTQLSRALIHTPVPNQKECIFFPSNFCFFIFLKYKQRKILPVTPLPKHTTNSLALHWKGRFACDVFFINSSLPFFLIYFPLSLPRPSARVVSHSVFRRESIFLPTQQTLTDLTRTVRFGKKPTQYYRLVLWPPTKKRLPSKLKSLHKAHQSTTAKYQKRANVCVNGASYPIRPSEPRA